MHPTTEEEDFWECEGCAAALYIKAWISPILFPNSDINITVVTDCYSLPQASQHSGTIDDKRLRIERNATRELIDKKSITIHCSDTKCQLGDRLTKTGASPDSLLRALSEGIQCLKTFMRKGLTHYWFLWDYKLFGDSFMFHQCIIVSSSVHCRIIIGS